MPTIRQQKLAEKVIQNITLDEPLNKGELLESVGYSHKVATHKPGEILDQKGVKEALFAMGFDSNNARRVVGEILNDETNEPRDRLKAANLVFDVNGDMAPEKHLIVTKKIISVDE